MPDIFTGTRVLRCFVEVASHGSFRRAAMSMGIQESSVSRGIRNLEHQIGASLFIRHSGGITLTLAGQRFLDRVRDALDQLETGVREAAATAQPDRAHLRVGVFSVAACGPISQLFADFARQYPDIYVEFHEASAAHHLLSIGKAQLDLAFTFGNSHPHSYDATEVWRERVFLAVCEGHPLTLKSRLAWSELAQERLLTSSSGSGDEIRAYVTNRVRGTGGEPKVVAHNIGRYGLLGLVAACQGIMPLLESETIVSIPGVTYRPIGGEALPIFVITSPKNESPAARALLTLAQTTGQSG